MNKKEIKRKKNAEWFYNRLSPDNYFKEKKYLNVSISSFYSHARMSGMVNAAGCHPVPFEACGFNNLQSCFTQGSSKFNGFAKPNCSPTPRRDIFSKEVIL
jgi:hypothetical protein